WQEYLESRPSPAASRHPLPRGEGSEAAGPLPPGEGGRRPGEGSFEEFEQTLRDLYASYTFEFAEKESGVAAATIEEIAKIVASAGTRLSTHTWRSATAG